MKHKDQKPGLTGRFIHIIEDFISFSSHLWVSVWTAAAVSQSRFQIKLIWSESSLLSDNEATGRFHHHLNRCCWLDEGPSGLLLQSLLQRYNCCWVFLSLYLIPDSVHFPHRADDHLSQFTAANGISPAEPPDSASWRNWTILWSSRASCSWAQGSPGFMLILCIFSFNTSNFLFVSLSVQSRSERSPTSDIRELGGDPDRGLRWEHRQPVSQREKPETSTLCVECRYL